MKKKVLSLLAVSALATLVLTGCGSKEKEEAGGEKGGNGTVEVVAKGFQHDFWKAVQSGAKKAAKEEDVTMNFVGPKDETAIAEQLEMLNNAINKKPSAIALAALDTEAELDAIDSAKSKDIPIIGFDSGVPGAPEGAVKATASTDNKKAGAIAAEKLYQAMEERVDGKPMRIGVVSQEVNSLSISERTGGFIEKMTTLLESNEKVGKGKVAVTGHDKYKNKVAEKDAVAIIELRVPAEVTDAAGKTEASALLEKKDLMAIYGSNEYGAKSIINADEGLGGRIGSDKDKILAVGFDSGALQQDAIRNGKFLGSVTQNPVKIGYEAVKLAVQASKGEKVADIDTGVEWYTRDNIDDKDIQELLYD